MSSRSISLRISKVSLVPGRANCSERALHINVWSVIISPSWLRVFKGFGLFCLKFVSSLYTFQILGKVKASLHFWVKQFFLRNLFGPGQSFCTFKTISYPRLTLILRIFVFFGSFPNITHNFTCHPWRSLTLNSTSNLGSMGNYNFTYLGLKERYDIVRVASRPQVSPVS